MRASPLAAQAERPLTEAIDQVRFGEVGWKDRYYEHKLHIGIGDNARRRQVPPPACAGAPFGVGGAAPPLLA